MNQDTYNSRYIPNPDQTFEEITYCNDCGEIVEERSIGTEGWTVCPGCQTIEGKTTTVYQCNLCLEEHETEECNCYTK